MKLSSFLIKVVDELCKLCQIGLLGVKVFNCWRLISKSEILSFILNKQIKEIAFICYNTHTKNKQTFFVIKFCSNFQHQDRN